jgi:hypothetical protein
MDNERSYGSRTMYERACVTLSMNQHMHIYTPSSAPSDLPGIEWPLLPGSPWYCRDAAGAIVQIRNITFRYFSESFLSGRVSYLIVVLNVVGIVKLL